MNIRTGEIWGSAIVTDVYAVGLICTGFGYLSYGWTQAHFDREKIRRAMLLGAGLTALIAQYMLLLGPESVAVYCGFIALYAMGFVAAAIYYYASCSLSGSSYTGKDTGNKTGYTGNKSSDSGFTWTGDVTKVNGYNDGSLAGLGLGPVDADTIKELVLRGAIEVYDDGTYKWADGWSAQNYMQRLKDFSISNIIGFKLPGLA